MYICCNESVLADIYPERLALSHYRIKKMPVLKTYITRTSSSRPTGGIFISAIFPEKTCAELTTVNKPLVRSYKSIDCKHAIFPTVKPGVDRVNNFSRLTTHDLRLTTNNLNISPTLWQKTLSILFPVGMVNYMKSCMALSMALILCCICTAQNLVPNPSFESYNNCPVGISALEYSPGYTNFPTVQAWVNPLQAGSADYFNSCASAASQASVPVNAFGRQPARTGNGYTGIIAWEGHIQNGTMVNSFGEYIQSKLTQPLQAGSKYCVSFYVSNGVNGAGTYNFVGIDDLGIHLSAGKQTQAAGFTMSLPYSVANTPGRFLTDTLNWMKITALYTATGGEEWLTLGWFSNGGVPAFRPVQPVTPDPAFVYRCYLYIDDISVMPVTNTDTIYTTHDTSYCTTSPVTMQLASKVQLADYQWSNGAITETINVAGSGTYWCVARTGCVTYIDSFKIQYKPAPVLDLGKELVNCNNQPVTIQPDYPLAGTSYSWSTGEKTDTITASKPGLYILTINNQCGTQTDSVHVYIQPPTPAPPPADTMICQFVEQPKINVPGENITWYTHANGLIGNTLQPPVVTFEPGTYSLFITQTIGKCESEKSPVNIDVKYTPHEELANKAVMCENDLKLIGKNADGVTYKWNTGSISCCVMPEREGLYQRAATNECGSYIDSIWVYHQSCDDCIVFPNAFTPVSGSANNIFRALLKCPVDEFSIRIYNRWGNIVYQAEDVNQGWNGRTNYEWAPQGVYIYIVEYRAKGKVQKQQIAGNVMLMR